MSIRYAYKESLQITKNLFKKHKLTVVSPVDLLPPGPGSPSEYEFDLACELDEARRKERKRMVQELKKLARNCKKFDQEDYISGINIATATIELLNDE